MFTNKLRLVGNLEKGKPFYIDNCDITEYESEYVYYYSFCKKRIFKIKDIYVKAIQLNIYDFIFYGERKSEDKLEIYELTDNYKVKFNEKYISLMMHIGAEERIKQHFAFLFNDYGFKFSKHELGNAVNGNGEFCYYGPLTAYCIYNEAMCLNILYLHQRQDYSLYVTDEYKPDQVYIRNGSYIDIKEVYNFRALSELIKQSIINNGKIFGHAIIR